MENGFGNNLKKFLKIAPLAATALSPSSLPNQIEKTDDHVVQQNLDTIDLSEERKSKLISYEDFVKKPNLDQEKKSVEEEISLLVRLVKETEENLANIKAGKWNQLVSEEARQRAILSFQENLAYLNENLLKNQNEYNKFIKTPTTESYKKLVASFEKAYKKYDEQQAWLRTILKDPAYRSRLAKEFGGDQEGADIILEIRSNRIGDKDYNLVEGSNVSEDAQAHFLPNSDLVELPTSPTDNTVGVHEFTHDMTNANRLLSSKAQILYRESFTDKNLTEEEKEYEIQHKKQYGESYFMDATERDAPKKQLEYDLEKLGVKKYGEEFTDAHYQKVLELQKAGKLSDGADAFVRMTKPEYFKKIMNEIANVDTGDLAANST